MLPYEELPERETKYHFIETGMQLDAVPVRILTVRSVPVMMREVDAKIMPDYVVVDRSINENDVYIIRNRYKVDNIIHPHLEESDETSGTDEDREKTVNLNMMSTNPVFLAGIHLRAMDLSKINQLLLDFDLTALDTEYILFYIDSYLHNESDESIKSHRPMLHELYNSYLFYLHLLQRNDEKIREMINSQTDLKKLAPFRTLVSKVKSIYPNREEQLLYTEYENIVMEKRQEFQQKQGQEES